MSEPSILLSLRPRFARAILDGTKTVELRRRRVRASPGTRLVLYASAPTMAVVGMASLGAVLTCDADAAWENHGPKLGLNRAELDDYLQGRPACLLFLEGVLKLDEPLRLSDLRQGAQFQPPQSYRFVSDADPSQVRTLASTAKSESAG